MAKYKVPPFSGTNYQKNSDRCRSGTPCAICGKEMKGAPHWAVVIHGGSAWGDENDDENDPGHMGAFPIGSDCHRKNVVK